MKKSEINKKQDENDFMTAREKISLNNKTNRQEAKVEAETAKTLERTKTLQGYVWVSKEKTSKHIHPDRVKQHLADGWKLTKKR